MLLGGVFFVTVAISNGWLTPPRQVALAVIAGTGLAVAALWLHDSRDRARDLLGQSVAAAGSGIVVLGLVAGARLYDEQVVPTWLALLGTGVAGGYMVFCAWRWRAQATAALGITTALIAPPLVHATASLSSAAFVAVALVVAGFVTVRCAWPWLAHAGLWLTVWQLGAWLFDYRPDFADETASTSLAIGVVSAVAVWWLLVTAPALLTERRGGWRVPPASVVVSASALATLLGSAVLAADEHPESWPVQLLGLTLVMLHVIGAVALWRTARPAALLLLALGGAIAALTASAIFGEAGQAVFWSIEAAALLGLSRRERDLQTAVIAALALVAAIVQSVRLVPPEVLLHGAGGIGRILLVGVVLTGALVAGSRIGRRPRRAWPWLAGAVASAAWTIQALTVSLVAPVPGSDVTDQTAQLAASGALIALALVVVLAFGLAAAHGPRHGVALALAGLIAREGRLPRSPRAGHGHDGGGDRLPAARGRPDRDRLRRRSRSRRRRPGQAPSRSWNGRPRCCRPRSSRRWRWRPTSRPTRWPSAPRTWRRRSASGPPSWSRCWRSRRSRAGAGGCRSASPLRGGRGRSSLSAALLLVTGAAFSVVAALTFLTPVAGAHPVDQRAQVVATVLLIGWWMVAAWLGRIGVVAGVLAVAPGVLGALVAAKSILIDTILLGAHGSSLALSAVAFAVAAIWPLRRVVARIPDEGPEGLPAIIALAVGGVAMAGLTAVIHGSTDATRGTVVADRRRAARDRDGAAARGSRRAAGTPSWSARSPPACGPSRSRS